MDAFGIVVAVRVVGIGLVGTGERGLGKVVTLEASGIARLSEGLAVCIVVGIGVPQGVGGKKDAWVVFVGLAAFYFNTPSSASSLALLF